MSFQSSINLSVLVFGLLNGYTHAVDDDTTESGSLSKDPVTEDKFLTACEFANRGNKLYDAKMYQAAHYFYSQAISNAPDEVEYYRLRGYCRISLKDFDPAIEDLKLVLSRDKDNDMDQVYFTEALHGSGRIDKDGISEDVLIDFLNQQSILFIFFQDLAVLNDTYLMLLGCKFYGDKQFEKALSCFNEAINKNPHNGIAYERRAYCHWKLNHLEEAIKDFEEILKRFPLLRSIEVDLVDVLLKAEKIEEAKKVLKRITHYYRGPITSRSTIERIREFDERIKEMEDAKEKERREKEIDSIMNVMDDEINIPIANIDAIIDEQDRAIEDRQPEVTPFDLNRRPSPSESPIKIIELD